MSRREVVAALALAGIFVALYLTLYKLGAIGELSCRVGSCETVNSSPWAVFLGAPVAAWGVGFYVATFAVAIAGLRPRFSEAQQNAAARYRQLAGTGQTSRDVREIVAAAYYGRVETLFAASGAQQWGVFNPDTGQVDLHEGPEGGDLLEFAALQTVLHRGTVYVTNPENMPDDTEAVSVFRYSVSNDMRPR